VADSDHKLVQLIQDHGIILEVKVVHNDSDQQVLLVKQSLQYFLDVKLDESSKELVGIDPA